MMNFIDKVHSTSYCVVKAHQGKKCYEQNLVNQYKLKHTEN